MFVNESSTVVVVLQYRLGTLGFLHGGADSNITGNYGLMDQRCVSCVWAAVWCVCFEWCVTLRCVVWCQRGIAVGAGQH
jgi:Carboxylesterase family